MDVQVCQAPHQVHVIEVLQFTLDYSSIFGALRRYKAGKTAETNRIPGMA